MKKSIVLLVFAFVIAFFAVDTSSAQVTARWKREASRYLDVSYSNGVLTCKRLDGAHQCKIKINEFDAQEICSLTKNVNNDLVYLYFYCPDKPIVKSNFGIIYNAKALVVAGKTYRSR